MNYVNYAQFSELVFSRYLRNNYLYLCIPVLFISLTDLSALRMEVGDLMLSHWYVLSALVLLQTIYTVCPEKVYHCIHYHNSGKQCRILTKYYTNNAASNCKRMFKYQ